MSAQSDSLEIVHEGWLTKSPPTKSIWRAVSNTIFLNRFSLSFYGIGLGLLKVFFLGRVSELSGTGLTLLIC